MNADKFDALLAHEPNTGCWLWGGATSYSGYGNAWFDADGSGKRQMATHRVAWIREFGPIPDGLVVCHKCDVKQCCNPAHLFVGTHSENTRDMIAKGRWKPIPHESRARGEKHRSVTSPQTLKRGSKHHSAKITEADVLDIRASTESLSTLSERYGMTATTLSKVRRGLIWRHVQ